MNNNRQNALISERPPLRKPTPKNHSLNRAGNHGKRLLPTLPWTISSVVDTVPSTDFDDHLPFQLPLTLKGNRPRFPSHLRASTTGHEERYEVHNTLVPAMAAPEPLLSLSDPPKQRKRSSIPRRKTVSFSTRLEYIPARSPSPDYEPHNASQPKSFPSTQIQRHPTCFPVSMPRRKPVPTRLPLVHPVPTRKSPLIRRSPLELLPKNSCRNPSRLNTDASLGGHDQFSLPPPEIQAAPLRVKASWESKGSGQFSADQQQVESFHSANLSIPENYRSQSPARSSPIIRTTHHQGWHGGMLPEHSAPHHIIRQHTFANKPREDMPHIDKNSSASASSHKTRQPEPAAPPNQELAAREPPGRNISIVAELPAEEVANATVAMARTTNQALTTMPELATSPESIMKNEKLSVARPRKPAPRVLRGLRRGVALGPEQPDLRQRSSLVHAGAQKALRKDRDPDDWYAPREYCSREWKPADQIMSKKPRVKRKGPIGKIIEKTRALIARL